MAAAWGTPGYLPNEPHFIANPNGTAEDDGVILTVAYDFNNDKSSLVIIDAHDMKTVQEFELPYMIPWSFHSGFWAK